MVDPSTDLAAEVRAVQPYRAAKAYVCPGCNQGILARTGHVVVVPIEAPDLRRHWHSACWGREARRAAQKRARPTS